MIVRYKINLRDPIYLEDHWPIPMMGGNLSAVTRDEMVIGFEIIFSGQPVNFSPEIIPKGIGDAKYTISHRDKLFPFVKMRLQEAFSFVQCYFDVEILVDEIEVEYAGETDEEEKQIKIKSYESKKEKPTRIVPFYLFTRAVMAAETGNAPKFEAGLLKMARTEMLQERYIDSFRYSFLLIESIFGDGKFKAVHLRDALKANDEFVEIVSTALNERMSPKHSRNSDTEILLSKTPKPPTIIDHIVEKRGFYFHGNVKRKNAWRPNEQESAESLCLLTFSIANLISQAAAAPMFDDSLSQRHLDDARRTGAIMPMNVSFRFRDPQDSFDRHGNLRVTYPGTKVTSKMAVSAAKTFLDKFEELAPVGQLISATCTLQETDENIFDIQLHVRPSTIARSGDG